ncbi:helix-turn-helix domain-containing protein [Pseudomonas retamae]|uniref:Transcriptional regulator n=1 Tax=Pseudomonas retamae TaxID=702110 RepID=A0ABW7D9L2_9PSED
MIEKFANWDSIDYLKTDEDLVSYLEVCMDEARGDLRFIAKVHGTIARARLRMSGDAQKLSRKGLVRL